MTALLLAEPEATMRGYLTRQLQSDGFDVLVLGDPDELHRFRVPDCPVIVLGGADPDTTVRALARCDDYLARPFAYEELLARIRALLRRCPPRSELIDLGELLVDRRSRRVLVRGREIVFSQKEFALLAKLASDADRVFTREHLLRDVWGYPSFSATRTLESHASRLRVKLGAAGLDGWVVNVWGVGYKLRPLPLQ